MWVQALAAQAFAALFFVQQAEDQAPFQLQTDFF
jgi:hypothetical protein